MGAFEPHRHPNRDLTCARCGRTLLLGELYSARPSGDVECDLCRRGLQAPDAGREAAPHGLRRLRLVRIGRRPADRD